MDQQAQQDINRKLRVLEHAAKSRNVSKTCQYFGISRETFYNWKRAYLMMIDETGLINGTPGSKNPKHKTPAYIEEKIAYLRTTHHLEQTQIACYLKHYYNIEISSSGVYSVLRRLGLNRLPKKTKTGSCKYKSETSLSQKILTKIV